MNAPKADLSEIVDLSFLQAMLSVFSKRTGLASAILDEDARPITFELKHCDFCKQLRRTLGSSQCRESDLYGIGLVKKSNNLEFYVCKNGLIDCCGPIRVNGTTVAYFFGAQFRATCGRLLTPPEAMVERLLDKRPPEERAGLRQTIQEWFRKTRLVETEADFEDIRRQAEEQLEQINGIVGQLHEWRQVEKVHQFMEQAAGVSNVEELLEITVQSLPDMMGAESSSIFLEQQDEKGEKRLVLRRTTFGPLKPLENTASYEKGEGLTGWVWARGRSLRIENLENPDEIAQYEGLQWRHKHNDSDPHRNFLAVPIFSPPGREAIGVIRVPKKQGNVVFTTHDEVFLKFLADYLGWAIQSQTLREDLGRVLGPASLSAAAIRLAGDLSLDQVLDQVLAASVTLFGAEGKVHYVNLLEPDGRAWRIERIGGNLPLNEDFRQRVFPVDQGTTGKVLRNGDAYVSSDIEESQRRDEYLAIASTGDSVIAAPMKFGTEVCGALAIVADKKYAFSDGRDLPLLEGLASLAAAAIRSARVKDTMVQERERAYALFARGALHALRDNVLPMEGHVSELERLAGRHPSEPFADVARALQDSLETLKGIFDRFRNVVTFLGTPGASEVEDVNSIVQTAVARLQAPPPVEVRLSAEPALASVNRFRVELVVSELVGNALRYVPPDGGSVVVEVALAQTDQGNPECRIIVSDNGPGIPAELKDRIFEDGFTTEEAQGRSGLGLFMARSIATFHGGRIWEEGTPEQGARFVLALPGKK